MRRQPSASTAETGDADQGPTGTKNLQDDTFVLPAIHEMDTVGDLHEAAQTWLSTRANAGSGRIELRETENVLSLQIAAAMRKSARSMNIDLTLAGPNGPLPHTVRFEPPAERDA